MAIPSVDQRIKIPDITIAKEKLGFNPFIAIKDGMKKTSGYFVEIQKQ